jgi:hypothetical protein
MPNNYNMTTSNGGATVSNDSAIYVGYRAFLFVPAGALDGTRLEYRPKKP